MVSVLFPVETVTPSAMFNVWSAPRVMASLNSMFAVTLMAAGVAASSAVFSSAAVVTVVTAAAAAVVNVGIFSKLLSIFSPTSIIT